jgi:hypothetical protein
VAGFAHSANASVLITVDKAAQQMSVKVDGELRWTWPVSTGRAKYDTPNGHYTAFRMEKEHYSKEWDDAPMPHSIFFTQIGHAIHGTYETKHLGHPASHGCVRLSTQNATKLFALVKDEGLSNTKVVIEGQLPSAAPLVAQRGPSAPASRRNDTVTAQREGPAVYQVPDDDSLATSSIGQTNQGSARVYVDPRNDDYYYGRRRAYDAPRVYRLQRGDRHVEIIEDRNIGGTWVRRHYYRQVQPYDDYDGR